MKKIYKELEEELLIENARKERVRQEGIRKAEEAKNKEK